MACVPPLGARAQLPGLDSEGVWVDVCGGGGDPSSGTVTDETDSGRS